MKLKEGDLFSISIKDKGFGLGQIIKIPNKETLSVIIYEELFENFDGNKIGEIVINCNPLFFGNTFDAKFYHRHWIVLDNNKVNLTSIKLPYYKIGSFPLYVEDFYEKRVKRASREEKEKLIFRKYVAPVRLENALLAYHGLKEWKDDLFNPLLYSYNISSDKLVNMHDT